MADGKHCPACGRDIGPWPVFSAGLPNRIRCPHCSARLTYGGIGGVVLALVVAMAVVLIGPILATSAFSSARSITRAAVFVGVLVGLWVPVELVAVWFLRGNRQLVLTEGTRGPAGGDRASPGATADPAR